jgi:hypothetical protein
MMQLYYRLKPLVPRSLQLAVRRRRIQALMPKVSSVWPIDPNSAKPPPQWSGWPDGKRFALVLTHDVELQGGHDKCDQLAALDLSFGMRSSFNFVPERYTVCTALRQRLVAQGFEVGVHGLKHDGRLFESEATFNEGAVRINQYLRDWNAVGFRAPSMLRNLEWISRLEIEYDASTFDTDPFEPQPTGVGTIFPFAVRERVRSYVELPYTLAQDFTVFIMLQQKDWCVWQQKLDWIAEHGGMALMCVHPDYMHFGGGRPGSEEYSVHLYAELLSYVQSRYRGEYWAALPREVARFWREKVDKLVVAALPPLAYLNSLACCVPH